ncbi:MAG: bifunctional (p)ppGpp synthetase/guanosine-3',5'-bis(diphosphate) 3'-pyrophosphohydrolase [Clostridia bacterium]|nr:bifunctional (p)ppGpp synthetase/guanosine-3',5'-bis(diphosphate) 3'-pyrophosphohydrolase [Clostridia bacterium]
MWDLELINKAVIFASKKHNGQMMKYPEDAPYSAHYFGVTLNAIELAKMCDFEIDWELLICSAIMHDTIEDTTATYDEVKESFGKKIADGVMALTKNESLEKEKQMRDSLERIKKQPKEIALVKLADRLLNISVRVPTWGKEKQELYKVEAQIICDELGIICEKVKKRLQAQIDNY